MRRRRPVAATEGEQDGEFLWLVSLSDLMILLFVFFVVLFSFAAPKMDRQDFRKVSDTIAGHESATPIDELQAKLLAWVVDRKLLESITLEKKNDALILEIKEHLLFGSGDFHLHAQSKDMVSLIGAALAKVPAPYRIGIEGHTDDRPLTPSLATEDNWTLSVRRARSVFKALDLSPEQRSRTVLMGYADTRPLKPNVDERGVADPEARAGNRRVTIRIF